MEPTDAELLVALGNGDVGALATLYDRWAGHAFGLARRILANPALAEEVVQDVFLALLQQAGRFDAARASGRSFILAMVHHKAVDAVRKEESLRRRHDAAERLDHPAEVADPADEAWDMIMGEYVRDALDVLTPDERRAVEVAYFGGYTYRQTAEVLGTAEGTVKTRMRSALRKLRETLETRGVAAWTTRT